MSTTVLDDASGASISKFLKKAFKKFDIENRKEMTKEQCITIFEEIYAHTGAEPTKNWEKSVQACRALLRGHCSKSRVPAHEAKHG